MIYTNRKLDKKRGRERGREGERERERRKIIIAGKVFLSQVGLFPPKALCILLYQKLIKFDVVLNSEKLCLRALIKKIFF